MVDLNDVVITCFPGFGTCVMAGNLMQTASTPAWKTVVVLLPESTKLPLDSPTKPINTTIQRHAMGLKIIIRARNSLSGSYGMPYSLASHFLCAIKLQ